MINQKKQKEKNNEEIDEQLQEEIKQFLKEKEKIRSIIGKIGGRPTRNDEIINIMFITLVLASFIGSIMLSGIWKTLAIDFAILLISLKISYMLYSASKVSHFQFWILSSIEWRINQMEKELRDIQKSLKKSKNDK